MRVEPYTVNSFVHVVKRGARGLPIVRDDRDRWRFARLLYHMNDRHKDLFWERNTKDLGLFERPDSWPERESLVKVVAWVLLPNHMHLLLKETQEGGITKFTRKVFDSMTKHFNTKYEERGSIFQGAFCGRTVSEDVHFRHLAAYIMVKNVFDMYPRGLRAARVDFDSAWKWAVKYPFSSLPDYVAGRQSPILEKDLLGEMFDTPNALRTYARRALAEGSLEDETVHI